MGEDRVEVEERRVERGKEEEGEVMAIILSNHMINQR